MHTCRLKLFEIVTFHFVPLCWVQHFGIFSTSPPRKIKRESLQKLCYLWKIQNLKEQLWIIKKVISSLLYILIQCVMLNVLTSYLRSFATFVPHVVSLTNTQIPKNSWSHSHNMWMVILMQLDLRRLPFSHCNHNESITSWWHPFIFHTFCL